VDATLWTLHPAVIDPKRLDLDAKRNQAYIKFARSHGYLPHEGEIEKESADMATATVATAALEDARRERARADQIQSDQLERARREAAEAKAETAKSMVVEPKTGTPAGELLSVVQSVAALATAIKPPADTSFKEFLALEAQREITRRDRDKEERDRAREDAKAERERADKLQAQIVADSQAARVAQTAATVAAPPMDEVSILKREVEKKSLLKQLYGKPAEEEAANKPGAMDRWAEALPVVAPILGTLIQGVFQTIQFGFTAWQNVHHNAAISKNGGTPTSMTEPQKPIAPQGPQPTAEQMAQHQALIQNLMMLEAAAEPIQNAVDDGESGVSFAELVIKVKRRPAYDQIRQLGLTQAGEYNLEQFVGNLRQLMQHPQAGPRTKVLYAKVAGLEPFGRFLADFFNYDEITAKEESADLGEPHLS
jgi:hypothetical protein